MSKSSCHRDQTGSKRLKNLNHDSVSTVLESSGSPNKNIQIVRHPQLISDAEMMPGKAYPEMQKEYRE